MIIRCYYHQHPEDYGRRDVMADYPQPAAEERYIESSKPIPEEPMGQAVAEM